MAGYTITYSASYESEADYAGQVAGVGSVIGSLTVEIITFAGVGLVEIYDGGTNGVSVWGGIGVAEKYAMSVQEHGRLHHIQLNMTKFGNPTDNVLVKITSTLDGTPLATSDLVDSSTLSSHPTPAWTDFTFSSPPTLEKDTTYYIELERDGTRDTSNAAVWWLDTDKVYTPGSFYRRDSSVWNTIPAYDLHTRLFFIPGGPRGGSEVTGSLSVSGTVPLAGSSAGGSTVTAAPYLGKVYSAVGVATVTGALTVAEAGGYYSAVGIATVTGTLTSEIAGLGGTSAGQGMVASVRVANLVRGGSAGVATAIGTIVTEQSVLAGLGTTRTVDAIDTNVTYMGYFDGSDTAEGLTQGVQHVGGQMSGTVRAWLFKDGSPTDNIRLRLHETFPTELSLADSDWVDGSTMSTTPGSEIEFTFQSPPVLNSDQTYFFQLVRSGGRDETNFYRWAAHSDGTAFSGESYARTLGEWLEGTLVFWLSVDIVPGGPRGAAGVEPNLMQVHELTGTIAGRSAVVARPHGETLEVFGVSIGSSTTSARLLWFSLLSGHSDGDSSVDGHITLQRLPAGPVAGAAVVSATLTQIVVGLVEGVSAGVSTVTGYLAGLVGASPTAGFEIPYPFLGGGTTTNLLASLTVHGVSVTTGSLTLVVPEAEVLTGLSSMTGTLIVEGGPADLTGGIAGVGTVTGWLLNWPVENEVYLAGTSAGVATVTGFLLNQSWPVPDPVAQGRYLYLLCNIGVSFDPTDDDSGDPRFVSQTFEDGDVWEFNRYLYLLGNIGVSFDPTDDDSADPRFVSQTFEDGDVWEFDRYLYLLCNVLLPDAAQYGNLTINEGYRGVDTALPKRTPPSRRF